MTVKRYDIDQAHADKVEAHAAADMTGKVVWEPITLLGDDSKDVRYFWRAEVNDGAIHHYAYFVTLGEAVEWCEERGLK